MREYLYRSKSGNQAGPVPFKTAFDIGCKRIDHGQGPFMEQVGDGGLSPDLRPERATALLRAHMIHGPIGHAIRVYDQSPQEIIFKVTPQLAYQAPPCPGGVPSIREIWNATHEEFDAEYGLVNLGICSSKEGEHHECNAWDIGVSKPKSATAIHNAILDIGNWLRNRMLEDESSEPGGLPVNGVIVMEQICSRYNTNWYHYSGTPHVSHVHVSGWPNLVPGWV